MQAPQHDRADELENDRELTGDAASAVRDFASEEQGYHKTLKPRQIQMIAIGGAIGTGLFMGAGARLNGSGPALILVYAICGFFGFLILRALGELVTRSDCFRGGSGSDRHPGAQVDLKVQRVVSLTQRRLMDPAAVIAGLPPDTRPLPSIGLYDELLAKRTEHPVGTAPKENIS